MFFSSSYTLPLGLADESIISARGETAMIDMGVLGETQTRRDLANLLHTAVELSGRNRCEIAREADLHKDALRRTLIGERSPSVGEALRILASSGMRSEEHTSELQSLMRISYAVFCLKKKKTQTKIIVRHNSYKTYTKMTGPNASSPTPRTVATICRRIDQSMTIQPP